MLGTHFPARLLAPIGEFEEYHVAVEDTALHHGRAQPLWTFPIARKRADQGRKRKQNGNGGQLSVFLHDQRRCTFIPQYHDAKYAVAKNSICGRRGIIGSNACHRVNCTS
jgi:hypothetical protein